MGQTKTDKDFKICTECAQNVCPHSLLINVPEKGNDKSLKPSDQIRLAKTIDMIARLTFPSAFVMFLAFFFFYYSVNANNQGILSEGTNNN